jgi:hypothetical protein
MDTIEPHSGYIYYQSIEHSLMASVYLSFLSDKQPEIHCTLNQSFTIADMAEIAGVVTM